MRDARREVALDHGPFPEASSAALAARLLGHDTRPSEAAIRAEMKARVQEALDGMDPLDREVLALRHFEQLSRAEIAAVLGISEAAAGKRYIRALERLKQDPEPLAGRPGRTESHERADLRHSTRSRSWSRSSWNGTARASGRR